jgi:uncharacterized protein (DUF1697 family)
MGSTSTAKPSPSSGRFVAFLRGITPMNAKMSELKAAFEAAGFADVRTVLGSGNVVFSTRARDAVAMERKAEAAMTKRLGRTFLTLVRSVAELTALLEEDPFAAFRIAPDAKRVVTFLRDAPKGRITLPIEVDGARILRVEDRAVFTAYVPSPKGPVFMALLKKNFGEDQTTRTWDTIRKVSR